MDLSCVCDVVLCLVWVYRCAMDSSRGGGLVVFVGFGHGGWLLSPP